MSERTKAALKILAASTHMQWCVADILESKATEMETLREWVLDTVSTSHIEDANMSVAQACEFHTTLIEVISGITKMESGLASHLRLLVEEETQSDFADGGLLGDGGIGI